MPTHDQVIANQTFPAFRADINSALAALFSLSSNATAPTTTIAGMLWYDTTANVLKQRNSADSGWNILHVEDAKGLIDISGNFIYGAPSGGTDAYAFSTGLSLSAVAAGMKFRFKADVANTTTASLNIDGSGAVTLKKNYNEDLETGDILANQIVEVIHDGTNYQVTSRLNENLQITNLAAETTLQNTDQFPFADASDSSKSKKITFADLITALGVTAATTSAAGISEYATTAEIETGTATDRSLVVDQFRAWLNTAGLRKVADTSGTGAASATLGNIFASGKDSYLVRIYMEPATDGAIPWLRATTGGGTPVSTGTPYAYGANNLTGSSSPGVGAGTNSAAANQIVIQRNGVGNASNEGFECFMLIGSPQDTGRYTRTWSIGACTQTDGSVNFDVHSGAYLSTTAVDGFQILFSTGNMDVYDVQVWQLGQT